MISHPQVVKTTPVRIANPTEMTSTKANCNIRVSIAGLF